MPKALSLLRSRPRFRALWLAIAISYTGSGAAATGLTLYVQERQGTGIAVGVLMLALSAPRLFGPLTGAIADRVELRRAMVLCDLGQAVCFAALATLPPLGPILGLAALTTLLQTIYGPARTAAVPALVDEDELLAANATLGIAFNLYLAVGPLLGGLVFAALGASWVMWLNLASFLASALLTTRLPRLPPSADHERPTTILATAGDGLRYVFGNPLTRTLVLSTMFVFAFIAIDEVALVFLVRDTLGGGAAAFGLVSASFGLGLVVGSLGVLAGPRAAPPMLYLGGLVVVAAGTLLTGLAPVVLLAALAQAAAGAGGGANTSADDTMVQSYVPRSLVGRLYGAQLTAVSIGMAVAAVLGGVLVDATSPRTAFVVAGLGALLVAACAAPVLRAAPQRGERGRAGPSV